ncbi:Protein of unknown function [Escherichia coli D6-113.11]|nr:Protein of unknown function [Escherichia coli D6-113.11]CDU32772.1 Protein of unknown function [Escherichia coli D6-113.11]
MPVGISSIRCAVASPFTSACAAMRPWS